MRLVFRLFRLVTLISLLFWGAVLVYILTAQPVIKPPSDMPQSFADCTGSYAMAVPYVEVQAEVKRRCADYFAVMGDRAVPLQKRLYARTIGRIVSQMITTYLAQYPPQPGERIGGPQMLEKLGTDSILRFVYQSAWEADLPPSAAQIKPLACLLKNARALVSQYDLQNRPTSCPLQP
jgi:hypothetical protein